MHQPQPQPRATPQHLVQLNEAVWISIGKVHPRSVVSLTNKQIGNVTELMGDLDAAINAYEQALRHNQYSVTAMNQISTILRTKENFPKAVDYLQGILKLDQSNGEVWGSLGMYYQSIHGDCSTKLRRSLLPDDGRSTASIHSLSAGTLPFERSTGMLANFVGQNDSV